MADLDPWSVLGIPPKSPWPQVRRAYLDLVQVWHPDRFAGDVRLQAKAAETLAGINTAYHALELRKREEELAAAAPPPETAATAPHAAPAPAPPQSARPEPGAAHAAATPEPQGRPHAPSRERGEVHVPPTAVSGRRRRSDSSSYAPGFRSGGLRATYDQRSAGVSARIALASAGAVAALAITGVLLWERARPVSDDRADPAAVTDVAAPLSDEAGGDVDELRPASGTSLLTATDAGSAGLEIDNETEKSDAVIILNRNDRHERAVYVRAGEKAVLRSIPPGSYEVLVMRGTSWSENRFLIDLEYVSLAEPMTFSGKAVQQISLKRGAGEIATHARPAFRLSADRK